MFAREKLKKYMKENGITNVAMAQKLGVSEGAVRHILVGVKQPSLAMTVELAQIMGCTVNDLVVSQEINT